MLFFYTCHIYDENNNYVHNWNISRVYILNKHMYPCYTFDSIDHISIFYIHHIDNLNPTNDNVRNETFFEKKKGKKNLSAKKKII